MQDPPKEVIKLLSEGQTLRDGQTENQSCVHAQLLERRNTRQALTKYGDNGILTVNRLLRQLIGSLATQTDLQKTGKKLNYLKQVLESRRDKQYSHKML